MVESLLQGIQMLRAHLTLLSVIRWAGSRNGLSAISSLFGVFRDNM